MMDLSFRDKIILWTIALGLVGIVSLYVFEFHWFANTFGVGKLVGIAIAFGVLLGYFIGQKFVKKEYDELDNLKIYVLCIFISASFSPLVFSLANRLLSYHAVEMQSFKFLQEKAYSKEPFGLLDGQAIEPDGYYIFFIKEGKVCRANSSQRLFDGAERGAQIELPIKKGLFGFEVISLE